MSNHKSVSIFRFIGVIWIPILYGWKVIKKSNGYSLGWRGFTSVWMILWILGTVGKLIKKSKEKDNIPLTHHKVIDYEKFFKLSKMQIIEHDKINKEYMPKIITKTKRLRGVSLENVKEVLPLFKDLFGYSSLQSTICRSFFKDYTNLKNFESFEHPQVKSYIASNTAFCEHFRESEKLLERRDLLKNRSEYLRIDQENKGIMDLFISSAKELPSPAEYKEWVDVRGIFLKKN